MKFGSVTRRLVSPQTITWGPVGPASIGDVLLCEVMAVGLHGRLETPNDGHSKLYRGDRLVCALGARYATALLEGCAELDGDRTDLLSASGVCGRALRRTETTALPTSLRVVAQGVVNGEPLTLRSHRLSGAPPAARQPAWVIVVGTAMDSGKTTACASLINSFGAEGLRVGAVKLTGTASARDVGSYRDAGADPVLDFLDCGWPSTVGCSAAELAGIATALTSWLAAAAIDVGVIEIADGLLQPETTALLAGLRLDVAAVILTARESMAAVCGVERLARMGYQVTAVSGVVSGSPLASSEVVAATGVPCVRTSQLGRQGFSTLCADLVRDRLCVG